MKKAGMTGKAQAVKKTLKATQIQLAFEGSHPLVWEYFRKKNILAVAYDTVKEPNFMKFLSEGQRIIVYVPETQKGFGIVGIGKVTGQVKKFLKGGNPPQ